MIEYSNILKLAFVSDIFSSPVGLGSGERMDLFALPGGWIENRKAGGHGSPPPNS
jgi:hypothetical protein